MANKKVDKKVDKKSEEKPKVKKKSGRLLGDPVATLFESE